MHSCFVMTHIPFDECLSYILLAFSLYFSVYLSVCVSISTCTIYLGFVVPSMLTYNLDGLHNGSDERLLLTQTLLISAQS